MRTAPHVDHGQSGEPKRYVVARMETLNAWGARLIEGMGARLTRGCRHVRGEAACLACIVEFLSRLTRESYHYPPGKWTTNADVRASRARARRARAR